MVKVIAVRRGCRARTVAVAAADVNVAKTDRDVPIHRLPRLRIPSLTGYTVRFASQGDAARFLLTRIGQALHAKVW